MTAARLASAVLLMALAGCQQDGTGSPSGASSPPASSPPASSPPTSSPTTSSPPTSSPPTGLGGGAGEQTSTPRLSTPSLSTAGTRVREVAGRCPYISAARFADLEGDRVGRVTVLQSRPVGCRFYFQYDPDTIVGEVTVARFGTATEAYNAMVRSATGHPEVQSDAGIGAGAVAFRTPLQGSPSWQCVFAKGTSVVTVRTRQPYPALNAFLLARAIVPTIK